MKGKAFHEHPLASNFQIACSFHKEPFVFPLHYHKEVEMIYVESGEVEISVMQKDYKVSEGQLVIIGCNHIHSYNDYKDESVTRGYHILLFDWKYFKNHLENEVEQLLYPIFFDVTIIDTKNIPGLKDIGHIFSQLSMENMNDNSGKRFLMIGQLYKLVGLFLRYGNFDEHFDLNMNQMEKEHELLSKVNGYIFENYKKGISLNSVSKALGYSEFHFARQFKRYTGITFKQYLMHYQISMAKEDVLEGSLTMVQVAEQHGFNSVKTFNRVFKTYFGSAPTVYRRQVTGENHDA